MTFDRWLIAEYGYEKGQPVKNVPPDFLTKNGGFDVEGYERWKDRMYERYLKEDSANCHAV